MIIEYFNPCFISKESKAHFDEKYVILKLVFYIKLTTVTKTGTAADLPQESTAFIFRVKCPIFNNFAVRMLSTEIPILNLECKFCSFVYMLFYRNLQPVFELHVFSFSIYQ